MNPIQIDARAAFSTAMNAIPDNVPIVMLNMLRFKEQADYGDRKGFGPCSGREAYHQHYAPAFAQVTAGIDGIRVLYLGKVLAHLLAPSDERWDEILLVEYSSIAVFRSVIEGDAYNTHAVFHRTASLADSRLIATTKLSFGGLQ